MSRVDVDAGYELPWTDGPLRSLIDKRLGKRGEKTGPVDLSSAWDAAHYGLDKVRVLKPVTIGDGVRIRDRIGLIDVVDKGEGRKLCKTSHLIEAEGEADPAFYAEFLAYWYPKTAA